MRSKRASFALPGVFLAGVLSVTGLHAEVDALVREAQELSTAGQGAKAYEMLEPQESQRAGDPDFDLAFGIAANQAAQYTRAIMALERLMALQPDNVRARTELGRALYGVGDNKAARKLLAEGQLNGITAVAGEPIDQLLHAIDRVEAEGNSSWRGYVEASAGQDSNINGAPGISSVAVPSLGGSILGIAPGGTKQSGGFGALAAGLSGRMVMDDPRWSLIGSVNVNDRQ